VSMANLVICLGDVIINFPRGYKDFDHRPPTTGSG
jgi:hypothetical protein